MKEPGEFQQKEAAGVVVGKKGELLQKLEKKWAEGKRPRKFPGAESGKTPEQLRREDIIEVQKARGEINRLNAKEEPKKRESGQETEEIEEIKKEFKREAIRRSVENELPEEYRHLIGRDDEQAWDERKGMRDKRVIALTLAGVASARSRTWLNGRKEDQRLWNAISKGLEGDANPEADKIREYLRFDKKQGRVRAGVNGKIAEKLGLNKSEIWYKVRHIIDKFFPKGFYLPGDLLESETGVSAENETKQKLLAEFGEQFPVEAILSHRGDASQKAKDEVEKYYASDKRLKWAYGEYENSLHSGGV